MTGKDLEQNESSDILEQVKKAIQDTLGIVTPVEQRKALRRTVTRLRGAADWRVKMLVLVVYTMKKVLLGTRVRVTPEYRAGRLPFSQQVLTDVQQKDLAPKWDYLKGVRYPVVYLLNDQDADDSGQIPEIPWEVMRACNETSGMYVVKGKALVHAAMIRLIAETFPKASEMVYAKRLGAPSLGNGFYKNPKVRFELIKSRDFHGNVINAGRDGSGKIHPMHPIWESLGVPLNKRGALQITLWDPLRGIFCKGILVCAESAQDEDGSPIIVFDMEQLKGKWKDDAKKKMKAGKTFVLSEGLYLGIMDKWDEPGTIKASFQFVDQIPEELEGKNGSYENTDAKEMVTGSIHREILRFKHKGGVRDIAEKLALEDEQLAMVYALCDIIGWDPMGISFYKAQIQERMERWHWHLAQGAGITAQRYIACIDDSVPVGHCVMRSIYSKTGERFGHGTEVVVTRSPIVLAQGMLVLKVLDPLNESFVSAGFLQDILIKVSEGKAVPYMVIFMNSADLVIKLFGDDDGDPIMVIDNAEIIKVVKAGLREPVHGKKALYALEPPKDKSGPKSTVQTWERGSSGPSVLAQRIMGTKTQGPVGLLAIRQAAFYALGSLSKHWEAYALAVAGGEQEALDSEKHDVVVSDLNAMAVKENWVLKDPDSFIYTLKPNLKASDECLEDPAACKDYLSSQWIVNWFRILTGAKWKNVPVKEAGVIIGWEQRLSGGDKMSTVLPWKIDLKAGEKPKRLSYQQVLRKAEAPRKGRTLVNYSLEETARLLKEELGEVLEREPEGDLVELLVLALGLDPEELLSISTTEYRKLLARSGLIEYGQALIKLKRNVEEEDDKHRRAEREEAILAEKIVLYGCLSVLSVEELVTIWVKELTEQVKPDRKNSKINRAFRAVCFPGSPVLAALGVDVPFTCTWAAVRINDIENEIRDMESDGRAADIIAAAVFWVNDDHQHLMEVGIPLSKCRHCRELVKYKGVSIARSKAKPTKEYNKFVAGLVGPINKEIARTVPWTPPKKE